MLAVSNYSQEQAVKYLDFPLEILWNILQFSPDLKTASRLSQSCRQISEVFKETLIFGRIPCKFDNLKARTVQGLLESMKDEIYILKEFAHLNEDQISNEAVSSFRNSLKKRNDDAKIIYQLRNNCHESLESIKCLEFRIERDAEVIRNLRIDFVKRDLDLGELEASGKEHNALILQLGAKDQDSSKMILKLQGEQFIDRDISATLKIEIANSLEKIKLLEDECNEANLLVRKLKFSKSLLEDARTEMLFNNKLHMELLLAEKDKLEYDKKLLGEVIRKARVNSCNADLHIKTLQIAADHSHQMLATLRNDREINNIALKKLRADQEELLKLNCQLKHDLNVSVASTHTLLIQKKQAAAFWMRVRLIVGLILLYYVPIALAPPSDQTSS